MLGVDHSADIPEDVRMKVCALQSNYKAGDVTQKRYIINLRSLVDPHLPKYLLDQILQLVEEYKEEELTEKGYCNRVERILQPIVSACLRCREDSNDGSAKMPIVKAKCALSANKENDININNVQGHMQDESGGETRLNEEGDKLEESGKVKTAVSLFNKLAKFTYKEKPVNNGTVRDFESAEDVRMENEPMENGKHEVKNGSDTNHLSKSGTDDDLEMEECLQKPAEKARGTTSRRSHDSSGDPQRLITDMFARKPKSRDEGIATNQEVDIRDSRKESSKRKSEEVCFDDGSEEELECDKRQKMDVDEVKEETSIDKANSKSFEKFAKNVVATIQRCDICHQHLGSPDLLLYSGHPDEAVEEFVALVDPKLSLFTGEEVDVHEMDERPQQKVTNFNVYDKQGHLCPFDGGLIERNVHLYFSGYLKPIYEEDSSPEGGIPVKDMGPINEWWISGFDGGEKALIGFSTAYGDYILMDPSDSYAPFVDAVREKIYLSKLVIEFLAKNPDSGYEDLLNSLQITAVPCGYAMITEDMLLRHAQFVCEQVHNFDSAGEDTEDMLITSPCVRSIIKLAGVTLGKRRAMRRAEAKLKIEKMPSWTKATTSPLVGNLFENFFKDQISADKVDLKKKNLRCGICDACQQPDCGECQFCKDMIKFGGTGKLKQCCLNRRCPNRIIAEAEENDDEEFEGFDLLDLHTSKPRQHRIRKHTHSTSWVGEPLIREGKRTYYGSVSINGEVFGVNDDVMVEPDDPKTPVYLARINHMWEDNKGDKHFHADWYWRGSDTVLGETADPLELFITEDCEDTLLDSIKKKISVIHYKHPSNWHKLGGIPDPDQFYPVKKDNGLTFWYQMMYHSPTARFETIPKDNKEGMEKGKEHRYCVSCARIKKREVKESCVMGKKLQNENEHLNLYMSVQYLGLDFGIGDCMFVTPNAFSFKIKPASPPKKVERRKNVNEDIYPEYYRKTESIKGSNEKTPDPFKIARILKIYSSKT
ncbi:DNA (cytosine-5)-methyltransferase 1, partial [Halocaridina rubra]